MGTSLLTFKERLRGPLGRNDSIGDAFIMQGVNFACTLVSLLFQPPELSANTDVTITGGLSTSTLSALTRLQTIEDVYNTTGSQKVWPISFSVLDFVCPSVATTLYNKFYSRKGSSIHVRPISLVDNVLTIYYRQYPLQVTTDGDAISFENFDSQVEAYALTYAMACLEESETSAIWQKIGETITAPQTVLIKTRRYLEGGPIYGDNPKGT